MLWLLRITAVGAFVGFGDAAFVGFVTVGPALIAISVERSSPSAVVAVVASTRLVVSSYRENRRFLGPCLFVVKRNSLHCLPQTSSHHGGLRFE